MDNGRIMILLWQLWYEAATGIVRRLIALQLDDDDDDDDNMM